MVFPHAEIGGRDFPPCGAVERGFGDGGDWFGFESEPTSIDCHDGEHVWQDEGMDAPRPVWVWHRAHGE